MFILLQECPYGDELPSRGFDSGEDTYQAPPPVGTGVQVDVDPKSNRLQLLDPFKRWSGDDLKDMRVLIKVTFINSKKNLITGTI